MNKSNPKAIALAVAFLVTLVAASMFLLFGFLPHTGIRKILGVLFFLAMFVSLYYLLVYVMEKFIYSKIKLIYKTIHTEKLSKTQKKVHRKGLHGGEILAEIESEVSQWTANRNEEIDEMKRVEAYRREFLGNVSHELKTPLFNIQGFILTLLDGGINDETINMQFLEKSQRNIQRMITIVEDLEIISRLETGEAVPELSNFALVPLVQEVFEFLEPAAREKNIKLFFAKEYASSVWVNADKEKIRAVLINLIQNSLKYGNVGGRTKVSIYDMDENYLIEISDDGVGIEEQHISRLFERFYRVDKHRSRQGGGSGLGLAIVKHIIEAHKQTINVRSALGIGSTFSFTLAKAKNS